MCSSSFLEPYCDNHLRRHLHPPRRRTPRVSVHPHDGGGLHRYRPGGAGVAVAGMAVHTVPASTPTNGAMGLCSCSWGVALFALGVSLAFWTMPRALEFLIDIGGPDLFTEFRAKAYIDFTIKMMLAFGPGLRVPLGPGVSPDLGHRDPPKPWPSSDGWPLSASWCWWPLSPHLGRPHQPAGAGRPDVPLL